MNPKIFRPSATPVASFYRFPPASQFYGLAVHVATKCTKAIAAAAAAATYVKDAYEMS